MDAEVSTFVEPSLDAPLEAHRNEESQLAAQRLLMPRLMRALTKQCQLVLAHRSLEAEQQSVVTNARVVHTLGVDQQRSYQTAQINQVMPVAVVAGQTRRLQGQDRPHHVQRDLGDQSLEPAPTRKSRARFAQVLIDELHIAEAQAAGVLDESPMSFEKDLAPSGGELFGATIVNVGRCHEADSRAPVVMIVVVEELAAKHSAVLDATKTTGELRAILQRFELGLGVGIVVRDVGSGVGLGHAEISQEKSHRLTSHRAATIRVDGELLGFNVLLATALGDEAFRERGTFSLCQHPANHVAREDIEDDVEVVIGPLDGAAKLGDIPRPNLVGRFGQQLRLGVIRMAPLIPALSDLVVRLQNPIHRANRAEVDSLVQQRRPDLGRRLVDETLGVQCTKDLFTLVLVECSMRPRTTLRLGRHRPTSAIQRGASHSQSFAGFRRLSNPPRQFLGRHDQSFSSLSGGFRGIPRSSEAFFGSQASSPLEPGDASVARSRARVPSLEDPRACPCVPA